MILQDSSYISISDLAECFDESLPAFTGNNDNKRNNLHTLLICNVIVGRCIEGHSDLKRMPNPFFHSSVNNMENPTIFCTFQNSQSYPLYLVHFRKNTPPVNPLSNLSSVSNSNSLSNFISSLKTN